MLVTKCLHFNKKLLKKIENNEKKKCTNLGTTSQSRGPHEQNSIQVPIMYSNNKKHQLTLCFGH